MEKIGRMGNNGIQREYIINRIKELSKGEYMSCYKWNGGNSYKNKDWSIDFPTDSQVFFFAQKFVTYNNQ